MASQEKKDLVFIQATEYTSRLRIHRSPCQELVEIAVENHNSLKERDEWLGYITELCESLKFWSELDELEALMQCDNILGNITTMKSKMLSMGVSVKEEFTPLISQLQVNSQLSSIILALLETPDGVERLECLPPSSLHKAMELLQRALNSMSPAHQKYVEVMTALTRLQHADSTANLEAPDITATITNISDEPFAKGGFSDVYTGEWLNQGKVALKILRILGGSGASKRHRLFRREVKLWHGLRHPHLLQFWGLCYTPQGLAMVSPFLANGNAASYLLMNPGASALSLLKSAAYGLEYLHTCKPPITHGDLRGANILVSPTGEACLADFGLSKIMEVASADSSIGMTTANAGATRWMAPELFHSEGSEYPPSCASPTPGSVSGYPEERRDSTESKRPSEEKERFEGVTPRSDVWAYGMTIYELMTGKVPYHRFKNSATVMLAILRGELPSKPKSSDVRYDWKPELFDLMQECWESKPGRRPTMSEISRRIRALGQEGFTITSDPSTVPKSLLMAFETPLQPLTPTAFGPVLVEEPEPAHDAPSYICDSPVIENAPTSQVAYYKNAPSAPIEFTNPLHKRRSTRRKSSAESSISRLELGDDLSALPVLPLGSAGLKSLLRPRATSAPMTVPTQFVLKEVTTSPQQINVAGLASHNSSQQSLASSAQFSKPSRPQTPATPVPEDFSKPLPTPDSPTTRRRPRLSTFWKRSSVERVSAEILSPTEGTSDTLRTVLPILRTLIEAEEGVLSNTFDVSFSTRLRTAEPPVVPLDSIDRLLTRLLAGYIKLRQRHSLFLNALRAAESMTNGDLVPSTCQLLMKTIDCFGHVYPSYAFGIYGVEEVLDEEKEVNFPFRTWLQENEDDAKLKGFLRKPLAAIESIFVGLSQLVAYAKNQSTLNMQTELKDFERQLVKLVFSTRLGKWQGAMGRDEVVFTWRQLVSLGNLEGIYDEARQRALFNIIETQMAFVRTCRAFHRSIFRRITHAPSLSLPHLKRAYTDMSALLGVHTHLLSGLHSHQADSHPVLTQIINIAYESVVQWGDLYSNYSSNLVDAQQELIQHNSSIFPIVHVLSDPLVSEYGLSTLLWLPITHLRRFLRGIRALLDVTADQHRDLKTLVELLSTLQKIIELCDTTTSTIGSSPEIRQLITQLQWPGRENTNLALEDSNRQILQTGRLLTPDESSDKLLELLVVLLDNSIIITNPRMRWGLSSLQVMHSATLEDTTILGHDGSAGAHNLYLLESSCGETIAAPLPLRLDTGKEGKDVLLLCHTTMEANEWRQTISSAKSTREAALDNIYKNVFHKRDWIATAPFAPTSSTTFEVNNTTFHVFGGDKASGLWLRTGNETTSRQILTGISIQQCFSLPILDIMIILSGKSLVLYKLADLVTSKISSRQIDTKGPVQFFRVGFHGGRLILIAAIAYASSGSSTLRIFEIGDNFQTKSRRSSYFGKRDSSSGIFKPLLDFRSSSLVQDCAVMDECMFLMGSDGFQHIETTISTISSQSTFRITPFPVFKGLASSQTYQRCKTSRPIGVVRSGDLYLLCYNDFGVFVNKQGLVQGQAVDWSTGTIEKVFLSPPYFLLAGPDAIEARLAHSGRLIDQLSGDEIRITCEAPLAHATNAIPTVHIRSLDVEGSRQFEVPAKDSHSIYEWAIYVDK